MDTQSNDSAYITSMFLCTYSVLSHRSFAIGHDESALSRVPRESFLMLVLGTHFFLVLMVRP